MQRDVVVRAQHGDHDAFTALVTPRLDRLYAAAGLILRSQDRAEDAVQDALVEPNVLPGDRRGSYRIRRGPLT